MTTLKFDERVQVVSLKQMSVLSFAENFVRLMWNWSWSEYREFFGWTTNRFPNGCCGVLYVRNFGNGEQLWLAWIHTRGHLEQGQTLFTSGGMSPRMAVAGLQFDVQMRTAMKPDKIEDE
jgi:hypothetical protein